MKPFSATLSSGLQCARTSSKGALLSSGIVASAVAVDVATKRRRNRQWEEALTETRSAVEETRRDQQQRLARLAQYREDPPKSKKRLLPWRVQLEQADECLAERRAAGFAEWVGIPLPSLLEMSSAQLQDLMADEQLLRAFNGGPACLTVEDHPTLYPASPRRTALMEWSILKLVLELLVESNPQSTPLNPGTDLSQLVQSRPSTEWKRVSKGIARQIQALQTGASISRPPQPRFTSNHQRTRPELDQTSVTALCAQLLLRTEEPDINIFNLLLCEFANQKSSRRVQLVRQSMEECNIRPNELTHATLLRFYVDQCDESAFHNYVCKLQGSNFGVARSHESAIRQHPLLLLRYRQGRRGVLVEKARLNASVYAELVQGLLHFSRRCDAQRYFRRMINEGWIPTRELLLAILQECLRIHDLKSAWALWTRLQRMLDISPADYGLMVQHYLSRGELRQCHSFLKSALHRKELSHNCQWADLQVIRTNIVPPESSLTEALTILSRLTRIPSKAVHFSKPQPQPKITATPVPKATNFVPRSRSPQNTDCGNGLFSLSLFSLPALAY